jgi:hypothetical protein
MPPISTQLTNIRSRARVRTRRHRLARLLVQAIPYGTFFLAIAYLSILPALLRAGLFDRYFHDEAVHRLGGTLTFDQMDLPSPTMLRVDGCSFRGTSAGLEEPPQAS